MDITGDEEIVVEALDVLQECIEMEQPLVNDHIVVCRFVAMKISACNRNRLLHATTDGSVFHPSLDTDYSPLPGDYTAVRERRFSREASRRTDSYYHD